MRFELVSIALNAAKCLANLIYLLLVLCCRILTVATLFPLTTLLFLDVCLIAAAALQEAEIGVGNPQLTDVEN
jgi:hypothetical protein